jgi:hypothetical protein
MSEKPKGALDVVLDNILNKINECLGGIPTVPALNTGTLGTAKVLSEIYENICHGCNSYIPS